MSYIPVQGETGGFSLSPQQILPIEIAVNLNNKWLFDPFFYATLVDLRANGWTIAGTGLNTFSSSLGRLQLIAQIAIGGSSQIVSLQTFSIPSPVLKDNIFWRAIVDVPVNAGTRFAHVGFIENSIEGSLTLGDALTNMGDVIGYIASEGQGNDNWFAMTQDAGVRTLTDTGVNCESKRKMDCRSLDNGNIEFLIDDAVVATHSSNIPTGILLEFRCGNLILVSISSQTIQLFGVSVATSETV